MRHFKKLWTICASVFLIALMASTAHADTTRQEFSTALQKWREAGIHDYSFTLNQICFCFGIQPVRITVKNDIVQSARNVKDGEPVPEQVFAKLPSMDEVFAKIADGYAKPADRITLTLNQTYGFPEHVYIDYVAMIADEELIYTISEFTH